MIHFVDFTKNEAFSQQTLRFSRDLFLWSHLKNGPNGPCDILDPGRDDLRTGRALAGGGPKGGSHRSTKSPEVSMVFFFL